MLYYRGNEWNICPFIAHYTSYGKQEFKYTNNKKWWQDFVQKWWHTDNLSFSDVIPTQNQLNRLDEINNANIPEGFGSESSNYVESGILITPDNPHFAGFTEQPDFTNSYSILQYENDIEDLLEQKAKEKGYKSADRLFSYVNSSNVQWKTEAEVFTQWRDDMFEYCYQMFSDVAQGIREVPSTEELIAELPEITWP